MGETSGGTPQTPEELPGHGSPDRSGSAREVAVLFLRLGLTAFGGPAAHIALFRDEVVTRRGWVTDAEFLDLLAASNLIPGPNSTEMAIHLGYVRAGWRGLVAGGTAFILPAFLIVLGVAALYARYGETPAAQGLLYGIEPVVIAVILQAIWGLSRSAIKGWFLGLVGVAAFGLYFAGVHELWLLFGGGLVVMLARNGRRLWAAAQGGGTAAVVALLPGAARLAALAQEAAPVTLTTLFLTFLKIGAVLYGSGYVLVAFLQTEFVERLGWIGSEQLLDAVAVGQFTPGPVFTTATFIGYLVAGWPGAVVATVGIFLPSFVFVAITNPFIPRMRRSPWLAALLDGVVAASLGLMAAVTVELARGALVDGATALIALAAAVLLIRFRVNSTWLILGGAALGLLLSRVGG
jgi:chromate transporter